MKVTPPERAMLREMARGWWASAEEIGRLAGLPTSKVTAKLRRLVGLDMVQSMDSNGKRYRLTAEGERWKVEHLGTRWIALEGSGLDARTAAVRHRDSRQMVRVCYPYDADTATSSKWGVEFPDGRFAWEPTYNLEALV